MPASSVPRAFVMGHPVAHSRSPMLHGYWLKQLGIEGAYDLCDVASGELEAFFAALREKGYVGGNVTVPHKMAVIPYVTRVDAAAEAIGAVNTIWLRPVSIPKE
jgi:shikimate dehydrogenase